MDQPRAPIRIPRLNTADAQRERSQAYRSPSASSSTSIHLPFASIRSNVYLSTARPGYIRRPRTQNRYQKCLMFGASVATPGVKPVLLQKLEDHLQKASLPEYKVVSERRLRIFQEAFDMFIDAFGVYKPVLSRIKCEYQALFEAYARRIQYIPQLKSRLVTMKDDANVKICSMEAMLKKEKVELEQKVTMQAFECESNQQIITSLKEEIAALQNATIELRTERDSECETKKTLSTALDRYKAMLNEANADKMQANRALLAANQKASNYQRSYETVLADLDAANHKLESLQNRIDSNDTTALIKDLQRAIAKANRLESEFLRVLDLYERAVGKRAEVDLRILSELRSHQK